ncbi:endonuclease/exonuclease/phosphatase family protein [Algoriphagus mannitolivorans]|uniref:endonuclease/exonuclease/phosphatase family protein n=1 Tax=Algoriphagus mannitolivorans TaxID=226504 RepID=UPI000685CE45|nr:endonuclease/exonuclease/phosphatase family protein [Algoriphagus mannitolivorans]
MEKFFLCCFFCVIISLAKAQDVKILTYNIYHGENPAKPGDSTFHHLADFIILNQPEVVALQEVDSMTLRSERIYGEKIDFMKKLSRETGYRGYFGKAMDFDEGGYGEGLLAKKGSAYHTVSLPIPAGGEPRAIAWVKAELKTLEEFYFGGTHLCHEFQENRLAQLDSILSYAENLDKPVVWVGDLNFTPDSKEYSRIPAHWKEAGAESGIQQNTFGTIEEGAKIDYIWYDSRKFELVEYKVLNQIPYSDHYPVWAVLRMKKEE